MSRTRPTLTAVFAGLTALLVATACGGDKSTGNGPSRDGDEGPRGGSRDSGRLTDTPAESDDGTDDGVEVGACVEGVSECLSERGGLQCIGGRGLLAFDCPEGTRCVDGDCESDGSGCTPGRRSCAGSRVMECDAEGSALFTVDICPAGCSGDRCVTTCEGDGKTYLGCTFFAVDLDNASWSTFGQGADAQQFAVTVSNPGDESVEVTVRASYDGSVAGPFTVSPDDLVVIPLPRADANDSSLTFNSYEIAASGPVTAHQFNPQNNANVYSNDASLLLPANALGTRYVALGWPTEVQQIPLFGPRGFPAFATAVAVADGTTQITVTASPRAGIRAGESVPAMRPGETQTFTLQRGQVLAMMSEEVQDADLTGMRFEADRPIALFMGNECAYVPHNVSYCDHLEHQIAPVSTWGTRYVAPKTRPRGTEPDVYRIVADQAGTVVTTNPPQAGAASVTLGAGEHVEIITREDFVITATAPVAVAQLIVGSSYPGITNGCNRSPDNPGPQNCAIRTDPRCGNAQEPSAIGDPALMFLVPDVQHRGDYLVLTPAEYHSDHLTIVVPDGVEVTVDGVVVTETPTPIPGEGVGVLRLDVEDGPHRVSATGPVGLYAYGYDCDVSYAYAGGMDLADL